MTQAGGAVAHSIPVEHRHDEIADGGHGLWGSTAPDPAGILTQGHVPHVVQFVLDGPVRSAQAQQLGRPGELRRQAGDLVVDLNLPAATTAGLMDQAAQLLQAGPAQPAERLASTGVQRADLDAPVPAINRARARRRLDLLESSAGSPAAAPAGCP